MNDLEFARDFIKKWNDKRAIMEQNGLIGYYKLKETFREQQKQKTTGNRSRV